ncbi:MAG: serine/threonine protein kinase [Planctomycetes bacterium]|nr:serine/threonine protein kinase [Planctomycetota bacterium]
MSNVRCEQCGTQIRGVDPEHLPDICPECGRAWRASKRAVDPILEKLERAGAGRQLGDALIEAPLGQGGMGVVYRGRHVRLDVPVAVKCLNEKLSRDSAAVERLRAEARHLATFNTPHLVRVYDVNEAHGIHYIIMDFVAGVTLREWVVRHGPMGAPEIVRVVRGIIEGLTPAHSANIMHRDIKPENIMLAEDGRVVVLDLGIAERFEPEGSEPLLRAGTLPYMAPEQFGGGPIDARIDVYALGLVIFFLATGRDAFHRIPRDEIAARVRNGVGRAAERLPQLPVELQEWFDRCTAIQPSGRYSSVIEFKKQMQSHARRRRRQRASAREASVAAEPPPPSPVSAPETHRTRRRWMAVMGIVLLLLVVGGLAAKTLVPRGRILRTEQFRSVQDAIDDAEPGDEIVISRSSDQPIRLRGKRDLILRGADPSVTLQNSTEFCLIAEECTGLEVRSLTFIGGRPETPVPVDGERYGTPSSSGVVKMVNCAVTLADCTVERGTHGLWIEGGDCAIERCTVAGNTVGLVRIVPASGGIGSTIVRATRFADQGWIAVQAVHPSPGSRARVLEGSGDTFELIECSVEREGEIPSWGAIRVEDQTHRIHESDGSSRGYPSEN